MPVHLGENMPWQPSLPSLTTSVENLGAELEVITDIDDLFQSASHDVGLKVVRRR